MKDDIVVSCLSSECPERFSLCCHAGSRGASEPEMMLGVPRFYCSKCGKEFEGGLCNAARKAKKLAKMLDDDYNWKDGFKKKFLNPDSLSSIRLNPKYQNGKADLFGDIEDFIEETVEFEILRMLNNLRKN